MWLRFFSVKKSLTLWISIKTTSVSKCQHPELKAITYVAPFYKPHLYFLKCQIRFFLYLTRWPYLTLLISFLFHFRDEFRQTGTFDMKKNAELYFSSLPSSFASTQQWKDYKNLEIQVRKKNQSSSRCLAIVWNEQRFPYGEDCCLENNINLRLSV